MNRMLKKSWGRDQVITSVKNCIDPEEPILCKKNSYIKVKLLFSDERWITFFLRLTNDELLISETGDQNN